MDGIVLAVVGFVAGGAACFYYLRTLANERGVAAADVAGRITREAELRSEAILADAKLKAKEEAERLRIAADDDAARRRREIEAQEARQSQREERMQAVAERLEDREIALDESQKAVEARQRELVRLIDVQKADLERMGGITRDQAKEQLMAKVAEDLQYELALKIKEFESRFREEAKRRATLVLAQAVHRGAADFTAEALVTVVPLPSDEMKGRIIGREGRNIRAFESITGVDVIVDDTPEAVVLSAFNSIKRELARLTMESLILDGRIHPAKIEQTFERCQKELHQTLRDIGEDAVLKMGLTGIHEKMIFEIGKLRYRTSFGQNLLEHSMEVANIAATIAAEIGANVPLARRAGFLHDIGKVADGEIEGPHALIGGDVTRKLGEKEDVVNAVAAHHEEIEQRTIEAMIVQVADTLSAGRPGARRSTLESYIRRLEGLEAIAREFPGVSHAYAIQAGREIRIIVRPGEVDDAMCAKLAADVAKKIEQSLEYPGQIKVVVMREVRALEIAR